LTDEQRNEFIIEIALLDRCCNVECEQPATFRVAWPGQPSKMCEPHKEQAGQIASVMGFELPSTTILEVEQLAERIRVEADDDTSVRFSLLELN